ncbi:MAG TPA: ribose-phosphate pyrophosphokinase, partial [Minicystis sp.]|nr:ribose-phosphate pyrophosphokinase [Minicystis sp.]
YVVQPTSPPVDEHLVELAFFADACRRAGAARVTAVAPYFGYARQDRRAAGREPVGARVAADVLRGSGVDRVVAVDLHTAAFEGFTTLPVEHLTAVPLLADLARAFVTRRSVVVAPDLGAAKLADTFGRLLELPVAIVHKTRQTGEEVTVHRITGDVRDKDALLVDDMISTGGTVAAAASALVSAGARDLHVVATHGLFAGRALERLRGLPIRRYLVTDSVRRDPERAPPALDVAGLAGLLADAVRRLARDESLAALLARG